MDTAVAPVDPPVSAVVRPAGDTGWLILRWSVTALAVLSRLWWLDGRPPHFDEGVNGWFTDQMRHLGYYAYDPGNYHGPLHFYVLFLFKQLLGRNLWALRLPTAFVGILTVEWCFRFERFLGRRTSAWAATAMLVSPAVLYFQRDAIHEAWLLYFLVLGFWGICGLCQEGEKRHLWAVGMALAGMILTKETWVIHIGCLLLAVPCVFLAEIVQPCRRTFLRPEPDLPHPPSRTEGDDAPEELPSLPRSTWITVPEESSLFSRFRDAFPPQHWNTLDLLAVAGTVAALIVFFYSGNFLLFNPANYPSDKVHHSSLAWFTNIFEAYTPWGKKAGEGEGHSKPFFYWCGLIARNEPWVVLGLLAALRYTVPGIARGQTRLLAWGLAVPAVCVAAIAGFHGYAVAPWPFHADPKVMGLALGWWSLAAAATAIAVIRVLLPPPAERSLRWYGVPGIALCLGAFFLPAVQTDAWLLGVAVLGAAVGTATLSLPAPEDWRMRLLSIYGFGALAAYSIIHYKTPWCIISLLWPFFFTAGAALAELAAERIPNGRETAMFLGTAASVVAAYIAVDLNFYRPTDDSLGYVYVQSFDDVWTVTNYLLAEARARPEFLTEDGVILCDSTYPLPWLLGDFEHIGYYSGNNAPAEPDGFRVDFLLVSDRRVDEVEAKLDADYYKQPIHLRPALEELQLYLRASTFAHLMPADREPEFHPVPTAPAVPASPEPGAPPAMQPTSSPENGSPTAAPSSSPDPAEEKSGD